MIEFATEKKGYNKKQVDEYLETVKNEYNALHKENEELKSKLAAETSDSEAKATAVARVLIQADMTAERVIAEANSEAEKITSEATQKAESILGSAQAEVRSQSRVILKNAEDQAESIVQEALNEARRIQTELAALLSSFGKIIGNR
ncbi:MAG: DivIVA domain-containing protein [Clostridia bacterium]|nr:DivIVA domain-containing protein [Clostridia bacterium]